MLRWNVNHHRQQIMVTRENKVVKNNFANVNLHIIDISQIQQTERCIINLIQSKYFSEEMKKLLMKKQSSEEPKVKKSSQIYSLDTYLSELGEIG